MESLLIKYEKSYLDDNHKLIDFAKKSKVQNENIRNEKTKKREELPNTSFICRRKITFNDRRDYNIRRKK